MKGPFPISELASHVESNAVGAYILSRGGSTAHYVGRSDTDLRGRIRQSVDEARG